MEELNFNADKEFQRLKSDAELARSEFYQSLKPASEIHFARVKKLEEVTQIQIRNLARSRTSSESLIQTNVEEESPKAAKTKKHEELYKDAMGRLARKQIIQENVYFM